MAQISNFLTCSARGQDWTRIRKLWGSNSIYCATTLPTDACIKVPSLGMACWITHCLGCSITYRCQALCVICHHYSKWRLETGDEAAVRNVSWISGKGLSVGVRGSIPGRNFRERIGMDGIEKISASKWRGGGKKALMEKDKEVTYLEKDGFPGCSRSCPGMLRPLTYIEAGLVPLTMACAIPHGSQVHVRTLYLWGYTRWQQYTCLEDGVSGAQMCR